MPDLSPSAEEHYSRSFFFCLLFYCREGREPRGRGYNTINDKGGLRYNRVTTVQALSCGSYSVRIVSVSRVTEACRGEPTGATIQCTIIAVIQLCILLIYSCCYCFFLVRARFARIFFGSRLIFLVPACGFFFVRLHPLRLVASIHLRLSLLCRCNVPLGDSAVIGSNFLVGCGPQTF